MPKGRFLRWVDPLWYRYLRRRYPFGTVLTIAILIGALGLGGYAAVVAMGAGSATSDTYVALTTTVTRNVKVRVHGRTMVKRIPVVKRVYAKPTTVMETRTIQTPGGAKVVTRPVVRYRVVYRKKVVLVHGKPVTVRQSVTDTRMLTDTVTNVVTNEHTSTVVNERTNTVSQTQTVTRTQTAPPETTTVFATTTEHVTTTTPGATVTVIAPVITVTVTFSAP
jgi:hypothetical protein